MVEDKTYTTQLSTTGGQIEVAKVVRIELFIAGKLTVIEKSDLPFYLGREDASCDLIVDGDTVSRRHCVFQMRERQVGLLDSSTNGTFIKPGRANPIFIHNDYYPLAGQGAIKLGQTIELDDPELLHYKIITE